MDRPSEIRCAAAYVSSRACLLRLKRPVFFVYHLLACTTDDRYTAVLELSRRSRSLDLPHNSEKALGTMGHGSMVVVAVRYSLRCNRCLSWRGTV